MPGQKSPDAVVQTGLRIKESLRAQLDAAARNRGVPLNAEITQRLERTLHEEVALGGHAGRQLAYLVASAFVMAGRLRGSGAPGWADDPECIRAGMFAAIDAVLAIMPNMTPEEIAIEIEGLKCRLLTRMAQQRQQEQQRREQQTQRRRKVA